MTKEEEESLRWRLANDMQWPHSSDVQLLLDMIDAAREACTDWYENCQDDETAKATTAIGETLGLDLNS